MHLRFQILSSILLFLIFLGTVQNDPKLYTNFSGFPRNWEALDKNLRTFYQSNQQKDMSLWFVRLNSTQEMKWILVSIRGGLDY